MSKTKLIAITALCLSIFVLFSQASFISAQAQTTAIRPLTPISAFVLSGKVRLLPRLNVLKGFSRSSPLQIEAVNTQTKIVVLIRVDNGGNYTARLDAGVYTVRVLPLPGFTFLPRLRLVLLNQNKFGINFTGIPIRKQ